jgi:hypothetical protein
MPGEQMRASDADRERTAELLREHHALGRLTAEEFGERLDLVFAARTVGDLDALLADLPAIDLYQLPAAGIRPTSPGAIRPRGRGGSGLDPRRGAGAILPSSVEGWLPWTAASALLLVIWLGVGIVSGGAAWLPWFLLIAIPWALIIARRPPD